jgi:hypothetical protein
METWFKEAEDQFFVLGKNDEEFWRTLTADKRVEADCEMKADGMQVYFDAFRSVLRHQPGGVDHGDGATFHGLQIHMVQFFSSTMTRAIQGRRLCETEDGRLGLVPGGAEVGDLVCVVQGGQSPLLIRKTQEVDYLGPKFELVGTTYVHGLMYGEALNWGMPKRDIILV